ncbi:unnamed protein product [Symbiodinium sp. KB8]|nr:unnamed protein product [Symbiodinium sp. KB8]
MSNKGYRMQELLEVKDLYEQKYGFPVEHETEELQESRCDSHPHVLQHSSEFVTRLSQKLAEVKQLYEVKYGVDLDNEESVQYDAQGTGVPRDCRVERLEQKLAEVKQLYEVKYGVEVDTEESVQYDAQGTPWLEVRGTGCPRDMRVERLERMLENVKGLYAESYGTGVPRDCRVERLEQKLNEANLLFAARYGHSALASQPDIVPQGGDFAYDEDGTLWIKSVTTGRLGHMEVPSEGTLADMLTEVKVLCNERFAAKPTEETQSSWSDEDGAPWVQVGSSSGGVATTDKVSCCAAAERRRADEVWKLAWSSVDSSETELNICNSKHRVSSQLSAQFVQLP